MMNAATRKKLMQLDLACQNRDLKVARRLSRQLSDLMMPGRKFDPIRDDAIFRTYAGDIHGWEIPCPIE